MLSEGEEVNEFEPEGKYSGIYGNNSTAPPFSTHHHTPFSWTNLVKPVETIPYQVSSVTT